MPACSQQHAARQHVANDLLANLHATVPAAAAIAVAVVARPFVATFSAFCQLTK